MIETSVAVAFLVLSICLSACLVLITIKYLDI